MMAKGMKVSFVIPGEPIGKGRPRFTKSGHPFTPAKTVDYECLGRTEYLRQCSHRFGDEPLKMTVRAYFKIPESASQKRKRDMRFGLIRPVKRPDGDNILKICQDMLNGVAFPDDAQIVEATVIKFYADDPRVEIELSGVREDE